MTHGSQASSTETPETKNCMKCWESLQGPKPQPDCLRYILYTGADEHESQPVQNRTTGRHLRQGGSSWTTAPAAAVLERRTGTQPGTPQPRFPWSSLSPAAHPQANWKALAEQRRPHQPRLQGKNSLTPVRWLSVRQRWKAHNSKSLPETVVHHDGIPFLKIGYRLCPTQPSHECPPGNSCRQLVQTGTIGNNVLFPLFDKRQRRRLLYFLQQTVHESRQLSKGVVALICWSRRMNEIIGNWNRNMCYREGDDW